MAKVAAIAGGGAAAVRAFKTHQLKLEEAEAYRDAKNRVMAATTRDIAEEERNKEFMHSRALAVAAASGGGVNTPGMVKVLSDINAEGEYRVMAKLWRGQDEAEGLMFRSEMARREARNVLDMAPLDIVTSAVSGYAMAGGF